MLAFGHYACRHPKAADRVFESVIFFSVSALQYYSICLLIL